MWDRKDLKKKGKTAFKKNYLKCVLAAFIISWILGTLSQGAHSSEESSAASEQDMVNQFMQESGIQEVLIDAGIDPNGDDPVVNYVVNTIIPRYLILAGGILLVVLLLLKTFVFQIFEIGGSRFFVNNSGGHAQTGDLLYGFKSGHYLRTVEIQFVRAVCIKLWGILFIIPGIVKKYEYCMIPYLLADHPELSRKEAFRMSKEMMQGQKWKTFLLDFSFIGWEILSALTMELVGVFYSNPYYMATKAELYLTLKENYK